MIPKAMKEKYPDPDECAAVAKERLQELRAEAKAKGFRYHKVMEYVTYHWRKECGVPKDELPKEPLLIDAPPPPPPPSSADGNTEPYGPTGFETPVINDTADKVGKGNWKEIPGPAVKNTFIGASTSKVGAPPPPVRTSP